MPERQSPEITSDPIKLNTSSRWSKPFVFSGYALDSWTSLQFILKEEPSEDSDSQALLIVVLSNPSVPGTDGVHWLCGRPVESSDALRASAKIVVNSVTPNLDLSVTIKAAGMPPVTSNDPTNHTYEINVFRDGDREVIARGMATVSRSVFRATEAI